ncbi:uncharacterized protein I303_102705 [Kwoniella dejecticola CBS 10117]|uniref:Uncharacterized protein n=1 Tax=Kwoniella dejecticola CBS 10117 TaxID=1296121 RepID=A0A1A6A9I1_9TREE|nr:uncharacterized protein I303_02720 [Kwoniella dejecticola CBS 10117]OBR86708.1 hypothetical protein I303_02720 [Kwoniella dejecticola CBS 10117]
MATAKYVPPSRRAGYTPSTSSSDLPPPRPQWNARASENLYSNTELLNIFNHPQDSTITFFSFPAPSRPPRIPAGDSESATEVPLPPSPPPPPPPHPLGHLVSYIVIFGNAHPAWEAQHELWTHTNAHKLIGDYEGSRRNFGRPIPVFKSWKGRDRRDEFEFIGWWRLEGLEIVEPNTPELKRMMQVKEQARGYGRNGRTASAWAESLSARWIKLKFDRISNNLQLREPRTIGNKRGERYLLEVGELDEELQILDSMQPNKN